MEGLDAGPLQRATASVKCEDSRPEAGMNEEATFMLTSVYERCSKGKLKVLGMFQTALAAIPGQTAPGRAATTYRKFER